MALRFLDSFDHYATADLGKKWTSVVGAITVQAAGRRSTSSLRFGAQGIYLRLSLDNQATWIMGAALRFDTYPTIALGSAFWQVLDGATLQDDVRLLPDGRVTLYCGTTALVTSTAVLSPDTYNYLEWLVTIHPTAGVSTLRSNGVVIATVSGANTRSTANSFASAIQMGVITANATANMGNSDADDLYICDGTGSAPHNTFLGDCRIDTLFPNAEGSTQQWTPSAAAAHSTLVDEATPNTTDYVSSSTPTHRELFGLQDLSVVTGTIYGVQLGLAVLKSDAGTRLLKGVIRSGASEAVGSTVALGTSQTYMVQVQTTDPATGMVWTDTAVNSVEVGAEVA